MQATEQTITEKSLQRAQNRLERGMDLVWTHAEEIYEVEPGVWSVPASGGGEYRVRLGETPACPCRDWQEHGGSCKHGVAARVMAEITPASKTTEDAELTRLSAAIETARESGDVEAEEDARFAYVYRLDALGKGQSDERVEAYIKATEASQRRMDAEEAKMTAEEFAARYVPDL